MEDILNLYSEPYDPRRPVVCFDETSIQLLADVRPPVPAALGRARREDCEYQRRGNPQPVPGLRSLGWLRHVVVTERRTKLDFAHQMRWLAEEAYPDTDVIRVVLDNLNTPIARRRCTRSSRQRRRGA